MVLCEPTALPRLELQIRLQEFETNLSMGVSGVVTAVVLVFLASSSRRLPYNTPLDQNSPLVPGYGGKTKEYLQLAKHPLVME